MIISYALLCSISDQKLLLKENSQKNTKQVEYCKLFETRSFGGERLKIIQKQGDCSR